MSGHLFAFLVVFSRVGSIMMLFPGIGEAYVTPRARLIFAFGICLLITEPLLPKLPPLPSSMADMARIITYEVTVGLYFGVLMRLTLSTLEAVGTIIGIQSGLSNATVLNPLLAAQSPLPSAFLSIAGITVMFMTGLDHMLFSSILAVYNIMPPGDTLMPGDMAQSVVQIANKSFTMGIALAMPFMIIALLGNLGLGLMQRLMPQVQLFLIALPAQIWGGMFLLSVTVAGILTLWLRYVDETVASFAGM
ncbi:MAG: flagellar biosynthetic protein FliR [Alphaproteobacteria bacterium]|nr:flagellar biosynthetic protein FliR [Alphaproteobacteria bacterium]MBV8549588.1 flagellar biosynthetic protein FliR [Alphaproteobacteria bacterium]